MTATAQINETLALMARFRAAALAAPGLASFHPVGAMIEGLETGVLRLGPDQAETVVFLTSGIHGAEQWAGTACQLDLLRSGALADLPQDVAIVLIHAANPIGAALGRRYTEENVDLCRNFMDFATPLPQPAPGYTALRAAFDAEPGQIAEADAEIFAYAKAHDIAALYAAALGGQYDDPQGIGFGGQAPTRARILLQSIMRTHAEGAKRIHALDYHTGVGPYGYGSIIAMQKGAALARMRALYGPWVLAPRDNPPPGFIDVTGHSTDGYQSLFPTAEVLAAVLEVGTLSQEEFLRRLIAEHRATRAHGTHGEHPDLVAARRALVDFFTPADPDWRAYLLHRGQQTFRQIMKDIGYERS